MSVNATINQCHTENQSNVCTTLIIPARAFSLHFDWSSFVYISASGEYELCTQKKTIQHELYMYFI